MNTVVHGNGNLINLNAERILKILIHKNLPNISYKCANMAFSSRVLFSSLCLFNCISLCLGLNYGNIVCNRDLLRWNYKEIIKSSMYSGNIFV